MLAVHLRILLCSLAVGTLALAAHADGAKQYFHVQSGSGFFVSEEGYAITNAHVVTGCAQVTLKGPGIDTVADVRAADAQHDLALLYTPNYHPHDTAPLRSNIADLKAGEQVYAIGYPGDAWKTGQYKVSQSSILDVRGPKDHPEWLQFSDSVQPGNSGSPLLDVSGNVVGVVVAKSWQEYRWYRINTTTGERQPLKDREPVVRETDAAISLATLEDFLNAQGISFHADSSYVHYTDSGIEDEAKKYIVNVQCRIPMTAAQVEESRQVEQATAQEINLLSSR